jgi:hypothetical protein
MAGKQALRRNPILWRRTLRWGCGGRGEAPTLWSPRDASGGSPAPHAHAWDSPVASWPASPGLTPSLPVGWSADGTGLSARRQACPKDAAGEALVGLPLHCLSSSSGSCSVPPPSLPLSCPYLPEFPPPQGRRLNFLSRRRTWLSAITHSFIRSSGPKPEHQLGFTESIPLPPKLKARLLPHNYPKKYPLPRRQKEGSSFLNSWEII